MRRILAATVFLCGIGATATPQQHVDTELMTYPEIAAAMRAGKTTVLVYNGGTEQRGAIAAAVASWATNVGGRSVAGSHPNGAGTPTISAVSYGGD